MPLRCVLQRTAIQQKRVCLTTTRLCARRSAAFPTAFNNYYPLKTDAVAWNTRFDTLWLSPANTNPDKNYEAAKTLHTMNFAFDTATNEIYSYGDFSRIGRPDGNESGVKWWKIAELSSPSLPVQFGGFTTGEVYLSLKAVSGKGDIVVDSIGGKTMRRFRRRLRRFFIHSFRNVQRQYTRGKRQRVSDSPLQRQICFRSGGICGNRRRKNACKRRFVHSRKSG